VLGAVAGGADSLLVLTGVVDVGELLAAPPRSRPTYVAPDLRGLLLPQPAVHVEEGAARCGSATATVAAGRLRVTGDGVEALRAACALAWRCADAGEPVNGIDGLG
jgi:hypothetical protein